MLSFAAGLLSSWHGAVDSPPRLLGVFRKPDRLETVQVVKMPKMLGMKRGKNNGVVGWDAQGSLRGSHWGWGTLVVPASSE